MEDHTASHHVTIRASPRLVQDIAALARRRGLAPTTLARAYLEEGVRMERFPGIIFRNHLTERLAGLAGRRADVWQVVETFRAEDGDVAATADYLQLRPDQVRVAIAYAAAYPEEIEALIAENRQASLRLEAAEAAQRALLKR
jgi:uncharacterized protein (DUF433 family)